jgi:hypothetical protein
VQRLNPFLSILFMLLAMAVANILDRWTFAQRRAFNSSFEPGPLAIAAGLGALLLVAAWTFLAWWALAHGNRWFVSLIFILSGLAVLLYPPLRMLPLWMTITRLRFFYEFDSRLAYTGAFIAVLGALRWLLHGRLRRLE